MRKRAERAVEPLVSGFNAASAIHVGGRADGLCDASERDILAVENLILRTASAGFPVGVARGVLSGIKAALDLRVCAMNFDLGVIVTRERNLANSLEKSWSTIIQSLRGKATIPGRAIHQCQPRGVHIPKSDSTERKFELACLAGGSLDWMDD